MSCGDGGIKVENLTFREAVEAAVSVCQQAPSVKLEQTPEKKLILPAKAGFMQNRLRNYLCNERGIDPGIVNALLEKKTIYEDKRGNVVFVGYDEKGKPCFASLRGTHGSFRIDCAGSNKQYGFHMTFPSDRLYVYEAPIDAMSGASIANANAGNNNAWQRDSRLSLSGTSDIALPKYLERFSPKEVVLCLDNDLAGREAATTLARKYSAKGYNTRIELPQGKDYNIDLLALRQKQRQRQISKKEHCI